MYYYKLSTSKPIELVKTEEYFSSLFKSEVKNSKYKGVELIDGSILFLHPAVEQGKVYVELHCLLKVLPEEKSLSFEGLSWFGKFCKINNSNIKVLRNNGIIPPSEGAIFLILSIHRLLRRSHMLQSSKRFAEFKAHVTRCCSLIPPRSTGQLFCCAFALAVFIVCNAKVQHKNCRLPQLWPK